MLFIDFETTGLLKAKQAELIEQPFVTEIYIAKTSPDLKKFYGEYHTLIKPPIPIPEHITKITGIDDETVKDAPTFLEIYEPLANFFVGQKTIVAHNINFDLTMLEIELKRLNKITRFPWLINQVCTAVISMEVNNGKRMKLTDLHEWATGKPHNNNAHRSKQDVFALIRCYKKLIEKGFI